MGQSMKAFCRLVWFVFELHAAKREAASRRDGCRIAQDKSAATDTVLGTRAIKKFDEPRRDGTNSNRWLPPLFMRFTWRTDGSSTWSALCSGVG